MARFIRGVFHSTCLVGSARRMPLLHARLPHAQGVLPRSGGRVYSPLWTPCITDSRVLSTSRRLAPLHNALPRARAGGTRVQGDARFNSTAVSVEERYQKKTPEEHVLLRPDSYVGSTEKQKHLSWVPSSVPQLGAADSKRRCTFSQREIEYSPALYKIFDEILVNAADNYQRDQSMTEIHVELDVAAGEVRVRNDGKGIPVVEHREENVWVAEMVLGQLLTGSNFEDERDSAKVTGGRNGFGAKLTNIFSTEFRVDTVDSERGLRYQQTWWNNMKDKSKPTITEVSGKADYTEVSFRPDLARFGLYGLEGEDVLLLWAKRVHDVAACNPNVAVYLNGVRLDWSFEEYVRHHMLESNQEEGEDLGSMSGSDSDRDVVVMRLNDRISTQAGGTHVANVADQVARAIADRLSTHSRRISASAVRNNLFIGVNCLIEHAAFDSQTKDTLTSRPKQWGSECIVPQSFVRALLRKTPIADVVMEWVQAKDRADIHRTLSSSKRRMKSVQVPKLDDALLAGGKQSAECALVLTEGDSAKALAVAGLSALDTEQRARFGIFPLRGKMLNVEGATAHQLRGNKEIGNLVTILGLDYSKTYETEEFITPLVKATKKNETKQFFSMNHFLEWKNSLKENDAKHWHIKYYKGLGTNTAAEGKAYFADLAAHRKRIEWDDESSNLLSMAFHPDKSEERKQWISEAARKAPWELMVDHSKPEMAVSEFVDKELIHYSRANVARSIPSAIDGLKPSQRKVLYACLRRFSGSSSKSEMKVAQLAGYVAENTAYHHGEASLHGTIIKMAQDFVGANNLPLLLPLGQFGTRLEGGMDSASPRYIFTRLSPITRDVFPEADDAILHYLEEDGQLIEPDYFVPIIPMALVNAPAGIGTGWSTSIPPYNPLDLIENLRLKLKGEPMKDITPYVHGFKGTIMCQDSTTHVTTGIINRINDTTYEVSELPVGTWTSKYKDYLERKWLRPETATQIPKIRALNSLHTDTDVRFVMDIGPQSAAVVQRRKPEQAFKLSSTIRSSNMVLFDRDGGVRKFENPLEIIDEFFDVRMEAYEHRRELQMNELEQDVRATKARHTFCSLIAKGELEIVGQRKNDIAKRVRELGLADHAASLKKGVDSLLQLPLSSLSAERLKQLEEEWTKKQARLHELASTTASGLWQKDLDQLEKSVRAHYKKKR